VPRRSGRKIPASLRGGSKESQGRLPETARLPRDQHARRGVRRGLAPVLDHDHRPRRQCCAQGDGGERVRAVRGRVGRIEEDHREALALARQIEDRPRRVPPEHPGPRAQIEAREVKRVYRALVWGRPARVEGRIEAALGRSTRDRKKIAVVTRGGRHAATRYRVVRAYDFLSELALTLETGRTHQVRVHLAHLGHPLIGDPLYGQGFKSKLRKLPEPLRGKLAALDRQALHAEGLAFVHPVTGTLLKFNSPLPAELAEIVEAFKEL